MLLVELIHSEEVAMERAARDFAIGKPEELVE
jgi:hypothetical protein